MTIKKVNDKYIEDDSYIFYADEFDFLVNRDAAKKDKITDVKEIRPSDILKARHKSNGELFKGTCGMTIFYCSSYARKNKGGREYIICV